MRYIPRLLDLKAKTARRSHFLFGPRQTGKSTLVRQELPDARVYNLLDSHTFLALNQRPSRLREELVGNDRLVVIDEIQRLPELLDEVHLLIEEHGQRFLLTGSSARKLRRGGVNLLGGRARALTLHPFVSRELEDLDLLRALNVGLVPPIYLSDEPDEDLAAYAGIYLREEIAAEGLARSIPAFGRFLEVAALSNGTILNVTTIANEAQVPRTTIHEYLRVLEDTLIAGMVPAWRKGTKRKPITTSKLYFFDTGVVRHLRNQGLIQPRSPGFGDAFETFICNELRAWRDYSSPRTTLHHWRSTSGAKVDFILGDRVALEVKGKESVRDRDLRGLRALREEGELHDFIVVSLEPRARQVDGIHVLPWQELLARLWRGELG